MVTVLREEGFRVVIFTKDHGPPHVHVRKANGRAKIELPRGDEGARILRTTLNDRDTARAVRLVEANTETLAEEWRRIHGPETDG